MQVKGSFEVVLKPADAYASGLDGNNLARMTLDKTFHGPLAGSSKGEMLSVMSSVDGSAGYVAIEQVEGSLNGRAGGFVLQHFGIMSNGNDRLVLEVVPDSATGELVGLTGSMNIIVTDGQHQYEFEFELPA